MKNIVAKEEVACFVQFLLFRHYVFKEPSTAGLNEVILYKITQSLKIKSRPQRSHILRPFAFLRSILYVPGRLQAWKPGQIKI